jgi:hypothetical protein
MLPDDLRFEEQPVPGTSFGDFDPLLARAFLRESERHSGRRPLYESHSDVELRLTIWAAP